MKKRFLPFVAAALFISCDPSGIDPSLPENDGFPDAAVEHDEIVLGEKLDDPYTVANMTKALNSLYPTKAGNIHLDATHLYVRFLPKGEEDYGLLEEMGVEMIDHPVDYRIVREGDWYHDPGIPEDEITWQYAIVPPDFEFPAGISHQLLDECFIAEHEVVTRAYPGIDWEAVERESFRLTGNADPDGSFTKSSNNPPKGQILVQDDRTGEYEGVKGVKVSCNVFVKFSSAYTDEEGNYELGSSFSSRPRYRLVFKNSKGFAFGFNLVLIQGSISTLGKGPCEGMDVKIDVNSDRLLFSRSVANNAAWNYYEQCADEEAPIKTPPSNLRIWLFKSLSDSSSPMLQQGALVDSGLIGKFLGEYSSILKMFLPDVTIGLKGKGEYYAIYKTVVHELAHASHYLQVGNNYWNALIDYTLRSFLTAGFDPYGSGSDSARGYCEVAEMWAYYNETRFYRDRYPSDERSFGTGYWFKPQIFFFMDERGITRYKIFRALTDDIHDAGMLKEKLLSMYPECKTIINQAFERYR